MCFPKLSKNINMIYNTTPWPHAMLAKAMYREHLYRSSYATEARHICRTIHTSTLKSHWGKKASEEIYDGEIYSCRQVLERERKNQENLIPSEDAAKVKENLPKPKKSPNTF